MIAQIRSLLIVVLFAAKHFTAITEIPRTECSALIDLFTQTETLAPFFLF